MQGLEYMSVVTIAEEVKVVINKSRTLERFEGWFISHSPFFFFSIIDESWIWKNRSDKEDLLLF